jgi:hypothetical protein
VWLLKIIYLQYRVKIWISSLNKITRQIFGGGGGWLSDKHMHSAAAKKINHLASISEGM